MNDLIAQINSCDLAFPKGERPVSERTQALLRKMLTKDYIRRISWIELFSVRIDEEGQYAVDSPTSPFARSN